MPRVVPSQVFFAIAGTPLTETRPGSGVVTMNTAGPAALSAILDLVNQIPSELITMDNATYHSFIVAKAQIKDILET